MKTIIQHGTEYMHMNNEGEISRPVIDMEASGQWRVIGAVERNNFGHAVRRYSLADIINSPESIPWQHKNGKQRTFIQDFDHGTHREWRSPKHCVFKGN